MRGLTQCRPAVRGHGRGLLRQAAGRARCRKLKPLDKRSSRCIIQGGRRAAAAVADDDDDVLLAIWFAVWGRKVAVRDNQTTSDTPTCRSPLSSLCHLRLSQRHHVLTIYEVDSRKRWANRPLNTLMLVNFIHQVNWQQTRKE